MYAERSQPIFDAKELVANEKRKEILFDVVCSSETVLVVGAGSSASLGYHTLNKFLETLEDLAVECDNSFSRNGWRRTKQQLEYARDIKQHIKEHAGNLDRYHALISSTYGPRTPQCDEFHRTLVGLPFKGILTTNYDPVLEAALEQNRLSNAYDNSLDIGVDPPKRVSEFLLAMDSTRYPRRIAHLHGTFRFRDSIILSIDDYEKAYGLRPASRDSELEDAAPSWSLHRKLLWSILATRRAVFVGFSMRDPYLNGMLKFVSNDLWLWNEPIHFAIMSITPENAQDSKIRAADLKKKHCVEVVFYEDYDDTHRGLRSLIEELAQECKDRSERDRLRSEPSAPSGGHPAGGEQGRLSTGAGLSSWMDLVNRRMEEGFRIDED